MKIPIAFRHVLVFSLSTYIFANLTIGMIGNETGHLLKCVKHNRKFINKSETLHMLKINIVASSLKIVRKNRDWTKSYDRTIMKVFTLCIWEYYSWSLTYFHQFISY